MHVRQLHSPGQLQIEGYHGVFGLSLGYDKLHVYGRATPLRK